MPSPEAALKEASRARRADRLAGDGFEATVERERLAGEDDDEDHPWAVLTDAPAVVVEVYAEQHDGWLDADDELGAGPVDVPPAPLELPDAPRRIKGSFRRD